jgi:hypothetical protein
MNLFGDPELRLRTAEIPRDHAHYSKWMDVGRPYCWCYQYQCKGDTDNLYSGKGSNRQYVTLPDLAIFNAAWQKAVSDPDWKANADTYICADFAHDSTGKGGGTKHVTLSDLAIFNAGWLEPVSDSHFADNPCPCWEE